MHEHCGTSQTVYASRSKPADAPRIGKTPTREPGIEGKSRDSAKEEQPKIEATVDRIRDAHSKIPPGDRPSLEPLLSEWGLTSAVLSKCNLEAQIKLLASVQLAKI